MVFQFESGGMKNILRQLLPDSFEDIVAANALFRPGPMQNIPHFVARKHQKKNKMCLMQYGRNFSAYLWHHVYQNRLCVLLSVLLVSHWVKPICSDVLCQKRS